MATLGSAPTCQIPPAPRRSGGALLALALLLAACGGSSHASQASVALTQPVSVTAVLPTLAPAAVRAAPEADDAREGATLTSLPVQDGDTPWSAEIEATVPPRVVSSDRFVSVTAEQGWDAPIQCFVYRGPIDAGASVSRLLERLGASVTFDKVRLASLSNAGLDPVLQVRAGYRSVSGAVDGTGELKIGVMPRAEYPLLCLYDGVGYVASFARVVTGFARSFRFHSKQVPPRRGELWYLAEGRALQGFSSFSEHALRDGSMRTVRNSSSLVPSEAGAPTTEDQTEVMTWGERGHLTSGSFVRLENGAMSHSVRLELGADGWSYSGEVQGKPIRGSFVESEPIMGRPALEQRIAELTRQLPPEASGGEASDSAFTQLEYWPLLDATRPTLVGYVAVPSNRGVTLRMTEVRPVRAMRGGSDASRPPGIVSFSADASGRLREISTLGPDGLVVASPLVRLPAP